MRRGSGWLETCLLSGKRHHARPFRARSHQWTGADKRFVLDPSVLSLFQHFVLLPFYHSQGFQALKEIPLTFGY